MAEKKGTKENIQTEKKIKEDLREFEENPYDPNIKGPEEIVRHFYMNNVSVLPVVSRRGILLGILTKDSVIAELSDIERTRDLNIDKFITKLAKKIPLDDLLPLVGNVKEFMVINLFGEIYGKWSRIELFSACEQNKNTKVIKKEVEKQQEDQILEWMIYLILENIPRALYAVNEKGNTIFYNDYFEDMFKKQMSRDVDIKFVEKSLKNTDRNTFFHNKNDKKDIYFFNKDMNFYYEKVPLISNKKKNGYLIYCDKGLNEPSSLLFPNVNMEGQSLKAMLDSVERLLIVDSIRDNKYDVGETAKKLKLTKKSLESKIKKYGIDVDTPGKASKK